MQISDAPTSRNCSGVASNCNLMWKVRRNDPNFGSGLGQFRHHASELIGWRAGVLLKESREVTLRSESKIPGNHADIGPLFAQLAHRSLHPQGICIETWTDAGAVPEQIVEVRTRQPRAGCNAIEIQSFFPCTLMDLAKRLEYPEIPRHVPLTSPE